MSTAPWWNPSAWTDKVLWIKRYFGDTFKKRIILTHHKDLNKGDFLVDDRGRNGTDSFEGEWIRFGSEQFPGWEQVKAYLIEKAASSL